MARSLLSVSYIFREKSFHFNQLNSIYFINPSFWVFLIQVPQEANIHKDLGSNPYILRIVDFYRYTMTTFIASLRVK